MIKNKSIGAITTCMAVMLGAYPASAVIPTIDAGNIAGTIGIVVQGATGIQQQVDEISNGSMLNATIGDSAGTLSKFKDSYGKSIEEGLAEAQATQKRIAEGQQLIADAEATKAARQAEYNRLMESINSDSSSESETSYDDGEDTADTSYDPTTDADYDPEATSTISSMKANTTTSTADTATTTDDDTTTRSSLSDSETPLLAPSSVPPSVSPSTVTVDAGDSSSTTAIGSEATDEDVTITDDESDDSDSAPALSNRQFRVSPLKVSASDSEQVLSTEDAVESEDTGSAGDTSTIGDNSLKATTTTGSLKTKLLKTLGFGSDEDSSSDTTNGNSGSTKFRVSPLSQNNELKIEKFADGRVGFSSRVVFASQTDDGTTVGNAYYKGIMVAPWAVLCAISVEDSKDETKLGECFDKIVKGLYAENSYDAINNRKDCQKMVFNAVIALLSESTNEKYNAANYDETLEKQEESSASASTVRDDSAVMAMSNEQVQKLLNRMSALVAAQIMMNSIQQICEAKKEVVEEDKTDSSSNGGE